MPPKFQRSTNFSREDLDTANPMETEGLLENNDDEDFFLRGPPTTLGMMSRKASEEPDRITQVRSQVQEVTGIMQENVGKIMERGERLDDLQDRSEQLISVSDDFYVTSARIRRRMWWQDLKSKIILAIVVIVILAVIIIPIVVKNS